MTAIALSASEACQGITITVTLKGMRSFRARLWLGSKLIAIAGKIIGCKTQVIVEMKS